MLRASWEEGCLLYGPVWQSTVIAALPSTGGLWHISKPNQQPFTFLQEEFRLDAGQVWMQEVPSRPCGCLMRLGAVLPAAESRAYGLSRLCLQFNPAEHHRVAGAGGDAHTPTSLPGQGAGDTEGRKMTQMRMSLASALTVTGALFNGTRSVICKCLVLSALERAPSLRFPSAPPTQLFWASKFA